MRRDRLIAVAAAMIVAAGVSHAQPRQNPSGMVEDVKKAPGAGVEALDYVFPGQKIQLGKDGELVVSYFTSCKLDTIKGGSVTIGAAESTVQGGSLKSEKRTCDTKKFVATTQTAEAGAAAKRLIPGQNAAGDDEVSLKSNRPIFRWDQPAPTNIRVFDVSTPTPKLTWSGSGAGKFIEYPANAPKLQPMIPYLAEIVQGKSSKRVNFMIDPELRLADTLMNRTVVVKLAAAQ
jgi:hypothetical protein